MPARLSFGFLQGHRAEAFGEWMLKSFAAVATVSQEQDVGIDSVGTLLRRDGRLLYAEGTFAIQFKAKSVTTIDYTDFKYKWLTAMDIPLFIGHVDLENPRVDLFTTFPILSRADFRNYTGAVAYLDNHTPNSTIDGVIHQRLGKPILSWTPADTQSDEFNQIAYSVISMWISLFQKDRSVRSISTTTPVTWDTNQVPKQFGTAVISYPDDWHTDLLAAEPFLNKLLTHFIFKEDELEKSVAALLLSSWLETQGLESAKTIAPILRQRILKKDAKLQVTIQIDSISSVKTEE